MSRLFDTLEEIHKNERAASPARGPAGKGKTGQPAGRRRLQVLLLLLAGCLLLAVAVYLPKRLPVLPGRLPTLSQAVPPATETLRPDAAVTEPVSAPRPLPADWAELNRLGLQALQNNNSWLGIFYLTRARELAPGRLEPALNLAVALAREGLYGPASRFFEEAAAIDPRHPDLVESLEALRSSGVTPVPGVLSGPDGTEP